MRWKKKERKEGKEGGREGGEEDRKKTVIPSFLVLF